MTERVWRFLVNKKHGMLDEKTMACLVTLMLIFKVCVWTINKQQSIRKHCNGVEPNDAFDSTLNNI